MQLISKKHKNFIINRLAEISGLFFFGLAIVTFGILFSYSSLDPSLNNITDQERYILNHKLDVIKEIGI